MNWQGVSFLFDAPLRSSLFGPLIVPAQTCTSNATLKALSCELECVLSTGTSTPHDIYIERESDVII